MVVQRSRLKTTNDKRLQLMSQVDSERADTEDIAFAEAGRRATSFIKDMQSLCEAMSKLEAK